MLKIFLIITVSAAVISVMVPSQYTATTTILPPGSQQDAMMSMLGANISGSLGDLGGIAGMLGAGTTLSDLFAVILESGTITGKIIKKFDLKRIFKTKSNFDTAEILHGITKIRVSPEGIVAVSVTWKNKYLAADIANAYITELDKFNTEIAMTVGKKYRIFIEQRLKETTDTLKLAEEALRAFQEKHRTVALDLEIESAILTMAELKRQILLLEVKKGAIVSSSQTNNPYVHNINKEIRELKKQLAKIEFGSEQKDTTQFGAGFSMAFTDLPEVSLEYVRLVRNVEVQQVIFEVLTQQYEQAKIMELKDTPTVQVLDRASPPEKRSLPKRRQIVMLAAIFSILLAVSCAFIFEWHEKTQSNKTEYARVANLYTKIRSDINSLKIFLLNIFRKKGNQ